MQNTKEILKWHLNFSEMKYVAEHVFSRETKSIVDISIRQLKELSERLPDGNKLPEKKLINQEGKLLYEKAISQLPEKYRIVYVLREIEGLKNPEIAICLDITESNVKVRLHRAKILIKEVLFKISSNANVFEFGNSRCGRMVERVMRKICSTHH